MTILFMLLCAVIGAYWFITDSVRVRNMAESYLTSLLGGPVTVGNATLSIFEGLRLDDVNVYIDESQRNDSRLFSAASFIIEYNAGALLNGQIEATRIIAIEPRVYLNEDTEKGEWNYQRLRRRPSATRRGMPIRVLPEIVLRNAQVEYSRSEGGRRYDRGAMTIEGQFTPVQSGRYTFQFQSLGRRQGVGPLIRGDVALGSGQLNAQLFNFEFGEDIKAMLPTPVHRWCEQHALAGRMDVEELSVAPPPEEHADPTFRAKIVVQGVKLSVTPEEWMGADDIRWMEGQRAALNTLRGAGLNSSGFIDRLTALIEPAPIQLKDVDATFVFTNDGIKIDDLTGKLEDISFNLNGSIEGYYPSAPAVINLSSVPTRNVEIPATPRYVASMPRSVREVYNRFRPRGTAAFALNLKRPFPGSKARINGAIEILDGSFTFENFPYPLRNTSGKIVLACDDETGFETLKLEKLRGRGIEGGPNANSIIEINGQMGPFTSDIGVDVVVTGQNISSEPAVLAAFPRQTQEALRHFDADGKGDFPTFSGDFVCRIMRHRDSSTGSTAQPDGKSRWVIETDIKLREAAGKLVAFPYPMSGVSGELKIRDDHVDIIAAKMERDDAMMQIDGQVAWGKQRDKDPSTAPATQPNLRPDLKIVARNVPIDDNLLNAVPADKRGWLERIGARGKFDLDGVVRIASTAQHPAGELDFDLKIGLKDASFKPEGQSFAVSEANGSLRLTPTQLVISHLNAKRDDADINASGSMSWPTDPAQLVLRVDAKNLMLDGALYELLPEAARAGWDQVQPEGTVDASLSYSGTVPTRRMAATDAAGESTPAQEPAPAPATAPANVGDSGGFELIITPRKLAATPKAIPYRLEQLAGTVTVLPEKVVVKDLTARHGPAAVKMSVTGTTGKNGVWDFQLAATNVTADDDFHRAAPKALAELMESMKFQGAMDFEFSKLRVATTAESATEVAEAPSTKRAGTSGDEPVDVDFAVKVVTKEASMEVGVALAGVNGTAEFTGSIREGKLHELIGSVHGRSLTLANRPANDFRATLYKPAEHPAMQISRMEARIAGGTLGGQVDWTFPEDGPSRYAVALVLRNADVKQLTGQIEQDIRGQLTASLNIEGVYNDTASRRGRGDVSVVGDRLYRIPLVLGLLQITELALPITGPFRDGSARYSIDGNRVTFEQIELRSKEMVMQGEGSLDFGRKQVRMTFITDARGWLRLPLLGDLMQGARNELLQIHVRGTLQEPKVSATSMNTFVTTIDEVFRGDDRSAKSN